MMVLEKLKNDKANHLINEIKCMQDFMGRENSNLNDLGYDYVGAQNMYRNSEWVDQITYEEK